MDVVTALLEASERRYSIDIQPEVIDHGDEAFSDAMGDFLVSMAAPQEIGGDGDGVKTVDEPVDAGMQPAEAEESAKNEDAGCLDCKMSIVPGAEQHADASTVWTGINQAGRLFRCCGRPCE
ncbi:hypothetical protein QTP88_002546 [Uroleucon formosanum]